MTAQAVGILIIMVTFAGWLRAVWAAKPLPVLRRDRGRSDV